MTDATADTIAHILDNYKTIAVVGLSPKSHRDSYEVAEYMQKQGYRIVPVNPAAGVSEILGEKVYPSLIDAAKHEQIDLVDVFRNSPDVPPVVDEAIAIGAKAVWMQLGIEHPQAADKARNAGLAVVQNKCLLIEHRRQGK
ncbi:MAG TPA: CoA-binding protein [Burkholderiaceae bacterium]|nr:CoA-binding protein [Burkholderiaceae bacterium]HPH14026.1 CoA-binding protein [Burkholderiaceae bacterium]